MALGQLYKPTGKALETAQQVLQVEDPYACNVAYGCPNTCSYCYVPYIEKGKVRYSKQTPLELVSKQLESGLKPEGVFLSFATDPFHEKIVIDTIELLSLLKINKIKTATLSKIEAIPWEGIMSGMTIVSLDEKFRKKHEKKAKPIEKRINWLKHIKVKGKYPVWISMEPYPTPEIWNQDIIELLEQLKFVDFIIFGKWNYDKRGNNKDFYKECVEKFTSFCSSNNIRYHIKSDTMKFING